MKYLLVFLLAIIVFLPNANAMQFFPLYPAQTGLPDVCILDNTNQASNFQMTKNVVDEWSNALDHLTHSHNWDMKLRVVDRMGATHCNIVIIYDLEQHDYGFAGYSINHQKVYAAQLGVTQCNEFGPSYCTINIHLLHFGEVNMTQTVEHEFGHALGLGHRQGDTQRDAVAAFLSDDIMFAKAKKFAHLTDDDIMALIHLYGSQGFHLVTHPPAVYEITHPTHFKVLCGSSVCTQTIK